MHDLRGSRILITGGAGFVGSRTCDLLIKEEPRQILIIDNFSRGSRENLKGALGSGAVKVIEGDIRDARLIKEVFKGIDYCFHFAAIRVTECAEEPKRCMEIMVDATYDILEACVREKIKKVVFPSSAAIYGSAEAFPTEESHHPYDNRSIYGAAKLFSEQLLRSFYDMYRLEYVVLRYFNVYGPRMDTSGKYTEVLVRWLDAIDAGQSPKVFGDGTASMDFVYVNDVARANVLAMKSEFKDITFNIGSGRETSLNQLLGMLLELNNSRLEPVYHQERAVNPVRRRLASTDLARKCLGFQAEYKLLDGLKELIAWRKSLKK
jgi:UDP-glucose 4-epimerase